jgi:hypothetical protein
VYYFLIHLKLCSKSCFAHQVNRMAQTTQMPIRLTHLPLELLLEILEHLDKVSDRACLVLSIHKLKAYVDERPDHQPTRYITIEWEESTYSEEEMHLAQYNWFPKGVFSFGARYKILARLSHDTPHNIPCWNCLELHHWQDIGYTGPQWTRPCRRQFNLDDPPLHIPLFGDVEKNFRRHHFHFMHLQSMMQRCYYGYRFGIHPESVSFIEVQTLQS